MPVNVVKRNTTTKVFKLTTTYVGWSLVEWTPAAEVERLTVPSLL